MKLCYNCKTTYPEDNFCRNKKTKDGLNILCRICKRHKDAAYKLKYPDRYLLWKFGITQADYDRMHVDQSGVCKICLKTEKVPHRTSGKLQKLSVDHCHTTLKVRGLLCKACNSAIGLLKDDINVLKRAILYLEQK